VRKLLSRAAPLVALGLAAVMAMPSAAYAAHEEVNAGVASGAGSISPGLTTTPTVQSSVTFDGTVVGGFAINSPNDVHLSAGVLNCKFTGSSTIAETQAQGQGSGMLMCTSSTAIHITIPGSPTPQAATVTVTCDAFAYVRVGAIVVILRQSCTVTVSSAAGSTSATTFITGVFLFEPDQAPPGAVTSYKLQGAFVSESV
jgi:hypothetical protein